MIPSWLIDVGLLVIKLAVSLVGLLMIAAYLVLAERKLLGRMQIRLGPNRAGWHGALQPIADVVKMITKEDARPRGADLFLYWFAPAVTALTAFLIAAVVPFGPALNIFGHRFEPMVLDLNVGVLYALAFSSIGVYGVSLGGWASNSKYSLLGAVRAAAQMISYELPLALSLVPAVMLAGSLRLTDIVEAQAGLPFILVQPVAFAIFLIAAFAEAKRIPFDLPEAENELMAGFHTEYSGMRFGLYFLGEYVNMIVLGSLVTVFFLGGWHGPLLPPMVWFLLKVFALVFVMIWSRGTLPRLRWDQLMGFCWKVLTPLALVNIVVTAGIMVLLS
ncbi:NADH-quinone oxidoreductase subunit NuoH [Desulfoferula mesophila]|uniref:NADH-quinone oxidoreductase subunit H n=1 Tax=Desulfoferula mesophila TaxID=3058419 RepID=A0AAU9EGP0_9BACT|nr:NADH-quinone oxidoreductase subunit H 2 [Desulfoferula mesophilus]